MTFGHQLVTTGTTLLLRALRAKQVTEAWRAAHELAPGGEFEPLGNGLLCLLHGERSKTETEAPLGKAFVGNVAGGRTRVAVARCRPDVGGLLAGASERSQANSLRSGKAPGLAVCDLTSGCVGRQLAGAPAAGVQSR